VECENIGRRPREAERISGVDLNGSPGAGMCCREGALRKHLPRAVEGNPCPRG